MPPLPPHPARIHPRTHRHGAQAAQRQPRELVGPAPHGCGDPLQELEEGDKGLLGAAERGARGGRDEELCGFGCGEVEGPEAEAGEG